MSSGSGARRCCPNGLLNAEEMSGGGYRAVVAVWATTVWLQFGRQAEQLCVLTENRLRCSRRFTSPAHDLVVRQMGVASRSRYRCGRAACRFPAGVAPRARAPDAKEWRRSRGIHVGGR